MLNKIIGLMMTIGLIFTLTPMARALVPNDTDYEELWYSEVLDLEQAWDTTTGDRSVVVAVLDTGVDLDHPDLEKNMWHNNGEIPDDGVDNDNNGYVDDSVGWDYVDDDNDPNPRIDVQGGFTINGMDHGTLVAGVIGAQGNNMAGVTGVNWKVKIMPLRILDSNGAGDITNAVRAIDYAREMGADVINLSFVGLEYNENFEEALRDAYNAGIIVTAAAGNENEDMDLEENITYPVCYGAGQEQDFVIGVAASNTADDKADFSNYGDYCVDIAAPGVDIWGTLFHHDTNNTFDEYYGGYWSGTSVATPMVSGTAALIKAIRPDLSARQIRLALQLGAEPLETDESADYFRRLGTGRLNAAASLEQAAAMAVAATDPTGNIYASRAGLPSKIEIYGPNGELRGEMTPFGPEHTAEIHLAAGDFDGDGRDELAAAAGAGAAPEVAVFEADGTEMRRFYAYELGQTDGVRPASADVDGDGTDEILTLNGPGKAARVKVFEPDGVEVDSFYPFTPGTDKGGYLAAGDLDADGADEIVVGAGAGLQPRVRLFEYGGSFIGQFDAYAAGYDKGVMVAAGDLDGDGAAEVITGTGRGGGPQVRVFNTSGHAVGQFFAYSEAFRGGVRPAVMDVDGDGAAEIITGAGPGGGPHVRIFDGRGVLAGQFFAFQESVRGGVRLAAW